MAQNTKQVILQELKQRTKEFVFTNLISFTANEISEQMNVSRSLASYYLNDAFKEGLIIKINSRPVIFLDKEALEKEYRIKLEQLEFYDLDEFKDYLQTHATIEDAYEDIVGAKRSLSTIIKQINESLVYPPSGLPMIIFGEKGTGKKTLVEKIYRKNMKNAQFSKNTRFIHCELSKNSVTQSRLKLFGNSDQPGEIDKYEEVVLVISRLQFSDQLFQEQLNRIIESKKNTKTRSTIVRLILLSDKNPEDYLEDTLIRNIPVFVRTPSLAEKSIEEKEEMIIAFLKDEAKKIEKQIFLSNACLRALVSGEYEDNFIGLRSTIQLMCARALQDYKDGSNLNVHTYHLPKDVYRTLEITSNENVVMIDVENYSKSDEIEFVFDYFEQILKLFDKQNLIEELSNDAKRVFDLLIEYLSFKHRIQPESIQDIETSLALVLDAIGKHKYINLPVRISNSLAKLLYIDDMYTMSLKEWESKNKSEIEKAIVRLKNDFANEYRLMREIAKTIEMNLEIPLNQMLQIMIVIHIHYYNLQAAHRDIFGLIVCHGYSTASSIADAVNTLLSSYVFDAVDMPLDTTVDEIKEIIVERLSDLQKQNKVIVMVDMGSLEKLGKSLNEMINCTVGVINNVSTRLALNVGNEIMQKHEIETILDKVSDDSKASYTIIESKKKDTILFTAEDGVHLAQRMRDLFAVSLPSDIDVDLEVCDYAQLITTGSTYEKFAKSNVLFVTGTSSPNKEVDNFLALEEIISGKHIDLIMQKLNKHLDADGFNTLLRNLRKNFTLQNVVSYLTILNPEILLANVSEAIDILQMQLQQEFNGNILIGIYIHVCCLIERLVTKSEIKERAQLDVFVQEQEDFITRVKDSFQVISKRYNVEMPISEIAYLYDFIQADSLSKHDELLDE